GVRVGGGAEDAEGVGHAVGGQVDAGTAQAVLLAPCDVEAAMFVAYGGCGAREGGDHCRFVRQAVGRGERVLGVPRLREGVVCRAAVAVPELHEQDAAAAVCVGGVIPLCEHVGGRACACI